jgi:hypothetical protein
MLSSSSRYIFGVFITWFLIPQQSLPISLICLLITLSVLFVTLVTCDYCFDVKLQSTHSVM